MTPPLALGDLQRRIVAELGPEVVVSSDTALYARDDGAEGPFVPGLVVRPTGRAQIAPLLRLCHELGVPLSPRGAGTGTVGGCLADHGGLVLDLAGLRQILDIDERSALVTVEPGVITAELQAAVAARGLFYPPDPASSAKCSIGGNIATNAGGPRACKYGVTGAFVLALDVVSGSGQPLALGHRSLKGVTGYDLVHLLVGAEGTLAVTAAATLRLLPQPAAAFTLLAAFPDEAAAAAAVLACRRAGLSPAALELADRTCTRVLLSAGELAVPVPEASGALLWIELDGDEAGLDRALRRAADCCRDAGALAVELAGDEPTRARLWSVRRALSYTLRARWPRKISEDVAVPLGRLPELIAAARQIGARNRLDTASFGHAGDGNLHVNFLYDPTADPSSPQRVRAAVAQLFTATIALGGTLSGEHGVGLAKRPYLPVEQPPELRDLQRAIKRAWDPKGILNPGKKI